MQITGAIFDMDGTLIDSLGVWDKIWSGFGETYLGNPFFRPDPVTEKLVRTTELYKGMALVHERSQIGESGAALLAHLRRICEVYYAEEVQLKAGVREFLADCRRRGVKMCIASASPLWLIEPTVKRFDIGQYFSRVVTCDEVGRGKEWPDVFDTALRYLGTPKETTWIFEDSVTAIETAVRAGYNTVGIYDKHGFNEDRAAEIATVFIGEGGSYTELLDK